jgi:hypothetical protein
VDPLIFTKLVLALVKAPTSMPKKAYAPLVALLMKPTDILRALCQFMMMLTENLPAEHEPENTTPFEELPYSEPTAIE